MKILKKEYFMFIACILFIVPFLLCSCNKKINDTSNFDVDNFTATDHIEVSIEQFGSFSIAIDSKTCPIAANSFKKLVNDGYYNHLNFSNIVHNEYIETDINQDYIANHKMPDKTDEYLMAGKENYLPIVTGSICYQNSDDNFQNGQFFIVLSTSDKTREYNGNYCCFGYVVWNLDEIFKIVKFEEKYKSQHNGEEIPIFINSMKIG